MVDDIPVCDVTGEPVDECDDVYVDDACVDNHCPECGEFDAECVCYDEADAADDVNQQELDEASRG